MSRCECDMTHVTVRVWHDSCHGASVTWLITRCECDMTHHTVRVSHACSHGASVTWQITRCECDMSHSHRVICQCDMSHHTHVTLMSHFAWLVWHDALHSQRVSHVTLINHDLSESHDSWEWRRVTSHVILANSCRCWEFQAANSLTLCSALMYECDMTHMSVTWLTWVWHDSHECDMTHMSVTWLTWVDMTHISVTWYIYVYIWLESCHTHECETHTRTHLDTPRNPEDKVGCVNMCVAVCDYVCCSKNTVVASHEMSVTWLMSVTHTHSEDTPRNPEDKCDGVWICVLQCVIMCVAARIQLSRVMRWVRHDSWVWHTHKNKHRYTQKTWRQMWRCVNMCVAVCDCVCCSENTVAVTHGCDTHTRTHIDTPKKPEDKGGCVWICPLQCVGVWTCVWQCVVVYGRVLQCVAWRRQCVNMCVAVC